MSSRWSPKDVCRDRPPTPSREQSLARHRHQSSNRCGVTRDPPAVHEARTTTGSHCPLGSPRVDEKEPVPHNPKRAAPSSPTRKCATMRRPSSSQPFPPQSGVSRDLALRQTQRAPGHSYRSSRNRMPKVSATDCRHPSASSNEYRSMSAPSLPISTRISGAIGAPISSLNRSAAP